MLINFKVKITDEAADRIKKPAVFIVGEKEDVGGTERECPCCKGQGTVTGNIRSVLIRISKKLRSMGLS